jgi:hypothetical protein
VWRWVADAAPRFYGAPLSVAAIVLVLPIALVMVNAMASWTGRTAARLRPAAVLRTE